MTVPLKILFRKVIIQIETIFLNDNKEATCVFYIVTKQNVLLVKNRLK